jgi:hypothetical protein
MRQWSTPEWRAEATTWLDERLTAAGITRIGPLEQPRVRPWATVLRADTTAGTVWLKAAGAGTRFEVGLYELLAATVPDRVLIPIATDVERGWIVLPDGGPPFAERFEGAAVVEPFAAAVTQYARLQIALVPHVDELLARGVTDMRPARMPERFEEALAATTGIHDAAHVEVTAMRATYREWCAQLERSAVPASLDHNDLHPHNVLGDAPHAITFYDWGDSVVAHPFAVMLVALTVLRDMLDVATDDPVVLRVRDAYLAEFASIAPDEDLVATLELACRVAKAARALTWERALRAARDDGEPIDDDWANAPLETLTMLLDPSYLTSR